MNAIEIILILLGIVIIIISCKLVDGAKVVDNREPQSNPGDIEQMKTDLVDFLDNISEEITERTEDELSRLSNEKIIAISEYSDQILEKINHNHEEVVFLYHMLSEKENTMKKLVGDRPHVDTSLTTSEPVSMGKADVKNPQTQTQQRINLQAKITKEDNKAELSLSEVEGIGSVGETGNLNEEILKLYAQGKTLVEISKLLEIGQGEVKLVIDLYRGRK